MNPEEYAELCRISDVAAALSGEDRADYVRRTCKGDPQRIRQVCSFLEAREEQEGVTLHSRPPEVTPTDLVVPESIGQYTIERIIAEGGQGRVYLGRHKLLGHTVAIKTLVAELTESPRAQATLLREATMVAALNHPNVAKTFDVLEDEGTPYVVMEFAEGDTLHVLLNKREARGLELSESLELGRKIALALLKAHQIGIIHRDLKPRNIMVGPERSRIGRLTDRTNVKLLDFGIGKLREGHAIHGGTRLIEMPDGVVRGTPGYMSPEQIRREPADHRTDVFAFGCILFECITGSPAIPGDSVAAVLDATSRSRIDWAALPADLPKGLSRLLRQCLRPDPEERPQDMAEVADVIDATLGHLAGPRSAIRRVTFAIAGLAVSLAAAAGIRALIWQAEPTASGATFAVKVPVIGTIMDTTHTSEIYIMSEVPGADRWLEVYGLFGAGIDNGTLFLREMPLGRFVWKTAPEVDLLASAFGPEIGGEGSFCCKDIFFADLDGDGVTEIVTYLRHQLYGASEIVVLRREDGAVIGGYCNSGHFYDHHVEDLDGDRCDEIVLSGTKQGPGPSGAIVAILDAEHCSGASHALYSPTLPERLAEQCWARVFLPKPPAALLEIMGTSNISATDIQVLRSNGEVPAFRICVGNENGDRSIVVGLDLILRPVSASASDELLLAAPPAIREELRDPTYWEEWLSGYKWHGCQEALALAD